MLEKQIYLNLLLYYVRLISCYVMIVVVCTSRLLLAFDSDGAGMKAVERAAEILLPLSLDVKVIQIPGGKDPDELYSTGGREAASSSARWGSSVRNSSTAHSI